MYSFFCFSFHKLDEQVPTGAMDIGYSDANIHVNVADDESHGLVNIDGTQEIDSRISESNSFVSR